MAGDAHENLWKTKLKEKFPDHFRSIKALDLGSADMNGTNKPWFDNCEYIGLDILPYKNVDVVCIAHEYDAPDESFDTVCSTSELEHDMYWQKTLKKMVQLLKPGGLMWFSAGHNYPEHGTKSHNDFDSLTVNFGDEEWANFYHNLSVEEVRSVLDLNKIFSEYFIGYSDEGQEMHIYFWGVKK